MRFFKKTDLLIFAGLILISVLVFVGYRHFSADITPHAEIYYRGELVKILALDQGKEEQFSVPEVPEVLFHLYPDGTVCFEKSDCPDQVCVNAGRVGRAGEFAACLPNQLVLKIVADEQDPDAPDILVGN